MTQYSFSNIKKMEPLVDQKVEEWIGKLDVKFRHTGKKLDFSQWTMCVPFHPPVLSLQMMFS